MGYGADMCIIRAFTIPVESPANIDGWPGMGQGRRQPQRHSGDPKNTRAFL